LDRTKGGLAGDIIITNQRACHGLGGVQARVLLLTTQQTRHNHISHTRHDHNAPARYSVSRLSGALRLVSFVTFAVLDELKISLDSATFTKAEITPSKNSLSISLTYIIL